MKASIIYHSVSGNTKGMAELIANSMNTVTGIEAKAFSIDEVDVQYVAESKCIILGSPIYAANVTAAMLTWIQGEFSACKPANKLGGAFATANYVHGGGELGINTMLNAMMVKGMLTYSGGAAFGLPVVHLGPVGLGKQLDDTKAYFDEYGKRMAQKTIEIFGAPE